MKATVVYCYSKVINELRLNKSELHIKTKGNTSTLRKQRTNRNSATKINAKNIETDYLITTAIFLTWSQVKDIFKGKKHMLNLVLWLGEPPAYTENISM